MFKRVEWAVICSGIYPGSLSGEFPTNQNSCRAKACNPDSFVTDARILVV